jgi:hypothetical protein
LNLSLSPYDNQASEACFKLKEVDDKLTATLFADDTVVYLAAQDDFRSLLDILKEWWVASGAN